MNMFEQPQDGFEKTNPLDILYSGLNLNQLTIANQFYERLEDKPLEVLDRYHRVIRSRGVCDTISYMFDKKRQARRTALFKVRIEKSIERGRKEMQKIFDYMAEMGLSGRVSGLSPEIKF